MQIVHSSPHLFEIQQLKAFLESHQVQCLIINEHLAQIRVPSPDGWVQLSVIDPSDFVHAQGLVKSFYSTQQPVGPDWVCECGERIGDQFTDCWRCGSEKGGGSAL